MKCFIHFHNIEGAYGTLKVSATDEDDAGRIVDDDDLINDLFQDFLILTARSKTADGRTVDLILDLSQATVDVMDAEIGEGEDDL